ncbi:MAG: PP2C family protein-serine/threonine phosphatase, partial [Thermodesulfovibrionales bacterium]|nr:PP2C family protein-serine/threonine phosphatase [Thermodesulfovibrionales bacterium]
GLIGVAEIINPVRKNYDKDIFSALCKQFAIAIENALLYKESLDRERLKHELEIASSIQKSFLPDKPEFKKQDFIVRAINIPAFTIGGDLYDYIDLSENKIDLVIGDISGKGISAALYMAKIISDFRHMSVLNKSVTGTIAYMNSIINNAPMGMFLTAIYMSCDVSEGIVEYINAGHLPFLKINNSGEVELIDNLSGPPLGIMDYDYQPYKMTLHKGETLLLITDGVIDATGEEGKHFGFSRLIEFVKKHYQSDRLIELLSEDLKIYSKGYQRNDDITILEIRRL